jgi:hypothetical protein
MGVVSYFAAAQAVKGVLIALPKTKFGNSPIMASGGSMTFRSTVGWTCDTVQGQTYHSKCVSSAPVPLGTIDWDYVAPLPGSSGTLGWTGLSSAWSLDIWARDNKNGDLAMVGGVKMCTTSVGDISATCGGTPTYLLIMVEGKSVGQKGTIGLMDSRAAEVNTSAVQYFDTGCDVHNVNNLKIPACEHPGAIQDSIDNQTYKCQHGSCQISIDK